MNKMLVWFHYFPEASEAIADAHWFEQIRVSAFQTASANQCAKKLFDGNFKGFCDFLSRQDSFADTEIILPANNVLYTQVSVPSNSRKRIMQALPFILEDNLTKDIDKQFFALGDVINGHCNLAIVSRHIIKSIFEQFKALAIPVSRMTSEIFQLPWYPGKWTVSLFHNEILLRIGEQSGISCNSKNIDFIFRLLLNQTSDSEITKSDTQPNTLPDAVIIYADDEVDLIEKIKSIAQEYDIDSEVEKGNLLKLAISDQNTKNKKRVANISGAINLLQGEYDPGNIKEIKLPFLKSLAAILIIWVLSQLSFMGYQWHLYKNELLKAETDLQQLYFKTFPDSKRLIDVRSQTESKLQQLQKNTSSSDSFLSVLGLVGQELRQFKNINIQNIRYTDGVLQINIRSKGFIFNKLKSTFEDKHGFLVEEKSSSKVKGEVHSIINFRLKSM